MLLNHSGLTPVQRIKVWLTSQNNKPKIIIGTRSSIFLPICNLGGIIFDEEHDQSYKQQDGFRYDAKEIARMLYGANTRIVYSCRRCNRHRRWNRCIFDIHGLLIGISKSVVIPPFAAALVSL